METLLCLGWVEALLSRPCVHGDLCCFATSEIPSPVQFLSDDSGVFTGDSLERTLPLFPDAAGATTSKTGLASTIEGLAAQSGESLEDVRTLVRFRAPRLRDEFHVYQNLDLGVCDSAFGPGRGEVSSGGS